MRAVASPGRIESSASRSHARAPTARSSIRVSVFTGTQPGATIVPKGSGFKFVAPSGSTGIVRVTVKENKRLPGSFKITLKTREAWIAPAADETELTTEITLNVGGQCFRGAATKVKP